MNNDEKERQRVNDSWANLIISFEGPYNLRELSLTKPDPNLLKAAIKEERYKIRLASTGQRRTQANILIQNKFSWPEYSTTDGNLEEKQNRIILILDLNDITIGTITLCLDTAHRLDADETFKAEVDNLRVNGKKLAEITNFAIEGSFNNKRIMAAIIHISYIYARRIHGCTDFVIEVKARHSRYYEKKLDFMRCGQEKFCSWTNGPAVLLCLDLDHMEKQIRKLGGHLPPPPGEKSLYPYFFVHGDEVGITNRLLMGD